MAEIWIYNTLTRRKERFIPFQPGHVKMYVCGVTVYDYCHLGHARVMVVFDVVYRYFRHRGFKVTYVRNITDIDDKIIQRAAAEGIPFQELTERYIEAMHQDEEALGVLRPTFEPRATQAIDKIIEMIQKLLEKGHAYVAENGDVYYAVESFKEYGKLSGKRPEELMAGARVEVSDAKRSPLDFVLWKRAKPGEPSWESPWGPGRPGWHIECSAMSTSLLGGTFDIHGGGQDLIFPHHENEIAQSQAALDEPFARYWMHVGFVRVNQEKMSKSLGNVFLIRELLKRYPGEAIRFFILSSHYRRPLEYTEESVAQAKRGLERLYLALRRLPKTEEEGVDERAKPYERAFHEAMADDFNTPEAIATLFELAREINRLKRENLEEAARLGRTLKALGEPLGILQRDPEQFLRGEAPLSEEEISRLIQERAEARKRRDFATADRIRDQLKEKGILLEDTPEGTVWRRG